MDGWMDGWMRKGRHTHIYIYILYIYPPASCGKNCTQHVDVFDPLATNVFGDMFGRSQWSDPVALYIQMRELQWASLLLCFLAKRMGSACLHIFDD